MVAKDYFDKLRSEVEEALRRLLPAEGTRPASLNEAIRYSVMTGGKRIRPVLCLAASEAVGGNGCREAATDAAAAIEFLHTYTLIHDDLPSMDNDLLRRGMPTVHAKYGEALAILAGDALQAYAFDVISRPTSLSPDRSVRLVRELSSAAGPAGVVGGQVEDIDGTSRLSEDRLAYVHQHKTADLFRAALRLGAISGGGDDSEIEALGHFGNCLGIAFQIVDDLLDAPSVADAADDGETSCLRLWSPDEARAQAEARTDEAVAALSRIRDSQARTAMSEMAFEMLKRVK